MNEEKKKTKDRYQLTKFDQTKKMFEIKIHSLFKK
jgi:hypothetical protein